MLTMSAAPQKQHFWRTPNGLAESDKSDEHNPPDLRCGKSSATASGVVAFCKSETEKSDRRMNYLPGSTRQLVSGGPLVLGREERDCAFIVLVT